MLTPTSSTRVEADKESEMEGECVHVCDSGKQRRRSAIWFGSM